MKCKSEIGYITSSAIYFLYKHLHSFSLDCEKHQNVWFFCILKNPLPRRRKGKPHSILAGRRSMAKTRKTNPQSSFWPYGCHMSGDPGTTAGMTGLNESDRQCLDSILQRNDKKTVIPVGAKRNAGPPECKGKPHFFIPPHLPFFSLILPSIP